ncbi:MAG: hypothetical protein ACI91F_001497, partial [Candidatus Binatia bacterium]
MGCRQRTLTVLAAFLVAVSFLGAPLLVVEAVGQDATDPAIHTPGAENAPQPVRRRRPGHDGDTRLNRRVPTTAPAGTPPDFISIPDRWRIIESVGVHERWYDPYNQNTLKGDRPIDGKDLFLELGLVWDTLVESRSIPVGRGIQSTDDAGDLDVFGTGDFLIFNQNLILEGVLFKGDTTFRPPDWELRATVVVNDNYVDAGERSLLNIDPERGSQRNSAHFAIQELLVDWHLGNKSHYYDFDSVRFGIQEFISDFRGFLYEDSQPGVRLFGNFFENRMQYNMAWFHRLEKDTNSGLNTIFNERADDVFVGNVYYQDFLRKGFTASALLLYNRNREGDRKPFFNDNGFLERPASIGDERPHNYDVYYLGVGGDGHFGRVNLTTNAFLALGHDDHNPIAQRPTNIRAWLLAAEASIDFDWRRFKVFGYHASGDDDPFDGTASGFDAVAENPNFAGADSSYWHRQTVPLAGGGDVFLSGRNAILPSLRPSKENGQSNFVNPGLWLFGVGGDFDILPELRASTHLSYLSFDDTAVLRTTRQQAAVDPEIGYDLS